MSLQDEIYEANVIRSTNALAEAWEDPDLSISEMCDQLESLIRVVEGKDTYADFFFVTNINNNSFIN